MVVLLYPEVQSTREIPGLTNSKESMQNRSFCMTNESVMRPFTSSSPRMISSAGNPLLSFYVLQKSWGTLVRNQCMPLLSSLWCFDSTRGSISVRVCLPFTDRSSSQRGSSAWIARPLSLREFVDVNFTTSLSSRCAECHDEESYSSS